MSFSIATFKAINTGSRSGGRTRQRSGIRLSAPGYAALRVARVMWRRLLGKRLSDAYDNRNPLFAVPKALQPEHVPHCRVFASRVDMIGSLDKGGVWAEVGTFEGRFARQIIDHCEPRVLHLMDLDFAPAKARRHVSESDVVMFHEGDSARSLAGFPDGYFDYIYIDGDHSLAGVVADVEASLRKLKADGILLFNDYIMFSCSELYPYGTVPVVNSLCNDMGYELVGIAMHPKMYCDVMLRRRPVSL